MEIGTDLKAFDTVQHFASWAALCPGNHMIRHLLCEAANSARRTNSVFRSFYQSLVPRKGHKKAIIAVAHKMLRTIYFLFTRRQAYRDPGIDYQAIVVNRNAPR